MTTYITIRAFTMLVVYLALALSGVAGFAVGKAHFKSKISITNVFFLMLGIPVIAMVALMLLI